MAVRELGASDILTCAIGGLSGLTHGTVAILLKRTTNNTNWETYFGLHTSGGTGRWQIGFNNAPTAWWNGTTSVTAGSIGTGVWLLLVSRKETGSVPIRHSIYNYSTETWTHVASANIGNATAPAAGGTVRFDYETFSERLRGRVAARAAWSDTLPWAATTGGDADIEAAGLHTSAAAWLAASPDAMWLFNQAAVTTDVEDVTGGGADQTARTGTTVITDDDPPGFDFSLDAPAADATLHVALGIDGASVKHAQASATLGLTLGLAGTAATTPHADAELGLNLGIAATAVKRGIADASLGLDLGIAATVGEPTPPTYLSVTVGPLRDPMQVDEMRDPILVGTASGELVTIGELRDTTPTIGELRDEQSPIIGELRDPLAVDEMRDPLTVDELKE